MAGALLIVFSNPTEGCDEDEFNRWYAEVHVPDILRMGGARVGRRYQAAGVPLLPGLPEPGRYAAIYEVEADTVEQIQEIAQSMQAALGRGGADISPTFDLASAQAAWLLPISEDITTAVT
jgi:hypothetical protein